MKRQVQVVLVGLLLLTGCSGVRPELGIEKGQLTPCPDTPNCVNSQAQDEEHAIAPIAATGTLSEVKIDLLEVLDNSKGSNIIAARDNYIRAEFTSNIFRFVDDVEFYIPEQTTKELRIQVRSASRVGYSDFGVNRKRIEKIRRKFKAINNKTLSQ